MAWAAVPLAIGGGALQGFGAIREGQATQAAYDARAQELARQGQIQKIAANQSIAENLRELQVTSGMQKAVIGSSGLNWDSPSAMAIQAGTERRADTDIRNTAFNAQQQGESYRLAGQAAKMSGRAALNAGYIKGAGSFFKAASTAASAYG